MESHILSIGINYPGTSYELAGCVNDAKDLVAHAKPYVSTATSLLDNRADRAGAHAAIKKFLARLQSGDVGIITLSSHGTRERIGREYHEAIVWADAELTYEKEVRQLLSEREKGSLLLLAGDLCNSGGLNRGMRRPRTIPAALCRGHALPTGKTKPLTYLAWTGCKATEYCFDARFDGRANGAFTYWMLKTIGGGTFDQWFKRIRKHLPSTEYPQTPQQFGATLLKKRKVPF